MSTPGFRNRMLAPAGLLACLIVAPAWADHPGHDRPGIGFSPTVPDAGDILWEQGLPDWSHDKDMSLYTADSLLRVGLGGPLELQLGTSWNHLSMDHASWSGRGDSSLGLKMALPSSGALQWGLLGSVTFTDGKGPFSGNQRQYLLGAAFNWSLGERNALGAYLETTHGELTDHRLLAISASHNFNEQWAAYVEAAWQHDSQIGSGSQAGAGLTWQVTPRVQLDGSFRHRLTGQADTWQAGLGVSVFFGDL